MISAVLNGLGPGENLPVWLWFVTGAAAVVLVGLGWGIKLEARR